MPSQLHTITDGTKFLSKLMCNVKLSSGLTSPELFDYASVIKKVMLQTLTHL